MTDDALRKGERWFVDKLIKAGAHEGEVRSILLITDPVKRKEHIETALEKYRLSDMPLKLKYSKGPTETFSAALQRLYANQMPQQADMQEIALISDAGTIWARSIEVGDRFEKAHFNVMADIRALLDRGCPEAFHRLNFQLIAYEDAKGRTQPCYRMTRDGFSLLANKWTGPKAMQWTILYIQQFNAMEAQLLQYPDRHESLAKLGELTEQMKLGFASVHERLDKLSSSKRKDLSAETKARHDRMLEKLNKHCHCCHLPKSAFEYDHFYSVQLADFQHTWKICTDCHKRLTSGELSRRDVTADFDSYQRFAAEHSPKQGGLL